MKMSLWVSELLSGHDFHTNIFKGASFCYVGAVIVLVLCILLMVL